MIPNVHLFLLARTSPLSARPTRSCIGLVFARTTPNQKLKIVEMTKARGDNTVTVMGDGVNDAPVLKATDMVWRWARGVMSPRKLRCSV